MTVKMWSDLMGWGSNCRGHNRIDLNGCVKKGGPISGSVSMTKWSD